MTAQTEHARIGDSAQTPLERGHVFILLLAVGYYAYRKYGTFGAGAFGAQKSKFELKKEKDVTVVCPACGVDLEVPRLGTLQLVVCDKCGNEGEMEV